MPFQDGALGFGTEFANLFYTQECSVAQASGDGTFAEITLRCDFGSRTLKIEKDGNGSMKMNEVEKSGDARQQYSRSFVECR
jgi:hypothetical protein